MLISICFPESETPFTLVRCNQLTRNRANSVTDSSIGFRSKTYTIPRINEKRIRGDFIFVRSQICPDPCKHGLSFMNSSCTLHY